MRSAILILAAALSTFAPKAHAAEDEPFDGYTSLCGHVIERSPTARLSLALRDADGLERIVLDPALDHPQQWFHRLFLIAHECAHHRMAHTTRPGIERRLSERHAIQDQELSADCWASETLTQAGYIQEILRLADQFWRRGFVSPGQGYPSGIQRSNVLRHCAKLAMVRMRAALRASDTRRDHHP